MYISFMICTNTGEDKIIPKNAAFFLGTLCINLDLELYHIFYEQ